MITLVLGGTRSGKSAVAERLVAELTPTDLTLTYVATARVAVDDADHTARVEAHRARRPTAWRTIECADPSRLGAVLIDAGGPVLVDSLGTWVSGAVLDGVDPDIDGLVEAVAARNDPTVIVSDEVGLSVHPPSEMGRRFVDLLGVANRRVADIADRVLLVVAGRVLELP